MSTYDTGANSSGEEWAQTRQEVEAAYDAHLSDAKMLVKAGALATAASTTILGAMEFSDLDPYVRFYVTTVGGAIEVASISFLVGTARHLRKLIGFKRYKGVIPIE